ncbi:MAG TPA: hemerythrin domain-containing protein, partial [Thermomicrobiales bacterium]|nr:hemerythrin domain-containing protein [Thermomicrobiales bacterium]
LAADAVSTAPPEQLQRHIEEAYAFLAHHLIPHAHAEEEALYPVVAQLMGAPEATATMRRDHVEVGQLTEELNSLRRSLATSAAPTPELEQALRRVLYGLYAVVTLHFAKEEEVYLPLLDARLTPDTARTMFAAMHAAAHHAAALH